jgi:Leucine-rich repeat (LRR) protein
MKRLLPLALFFTIMANAQIVNIPDAAFKAQLLSASPTVQVAQDFSDQWIKIDANNDGEIQVSEAEAVKTLAISELIIFNVTGLDSFSNLENLRINSSLIITLNLTALTNLKTLSCTNMQILSGLNTNNLNNLTSIIFYGLPNLTTLDLSTVANLSKFTCFSTAIANLNLNGLTNLTEVQYIDNTHSSSLNFSGLTSITKINCSGNNLSTLNVNGLSNLTDLNCSSNMLTNLNGIPSSVVKLNCSYNKLTAINLNGMANLSELDCSNNDITSLNVNELANLSKIICAGTKITSLNISGLLNLTTLNCSRNDDLTNVTLANLPALLEFNVTGNVTSSSEVLSNLTSLNLSGLPNLQKLICNYGKLTSLDLNGLPGLIELDCSSNLLSTLNLVNLPNLQKLNCKMNRIASLNASNLNSLVELNCGGGYIEAGQYVGPLLSSLTVTGLPNLKKLDCSINLLPNTDFSGLTNLEELYCDGTPSVYGYMTSLNINSLTHLKKLNCSYQRLTSLDVSNLVNLTDLYCQYNNINSLNLNGLVNLKTLDYTYNQLASLSLVNLPSLEYLFCNHNQLTTLNVLNLTNLKTLWCTNNLLTTLNLSGLSSLLSLDISYNNLSLADVSGLSTNLEYLACMSNNLTSLDVSGLTNLEQLSCQDNHLTTLDVSSLTNLRNFSCYQNELTSLNLGSLQHLETLDCSNNLLTSIDISGLNNLYGLNCATNQLTSIDLSNHQNLSSLGYGHNAIPNLDLSLVPNLKTLTFESTQTTVMDLSNMVHLEAVGCDSNDLTTIDVSNSPNLDYLRCPNNPNLTTIFMKNGKNEQTVYLYNTPNLQYICADDGQLQAIQAQLNGLGMNATVCNSYCTFTPGGNHNTITGITIFDANNDGCDVTDVVNPFIRLNINDTSVDGATVTNINGTYNFYTNAGDYVISSNTENPTWFDFSPASANFSFPDNNNNISAQNFCITAVGTHKDIEVVFSQVEAARPGFDAKYKIVFKNKGNQMQSGTVNLQFDDARTDFISSSPDVDINAANSLSWNFTNLMPFENRSILLTLNINEPGDTPAVNNGDILNFTASLPVTGDEFPADNQFDYQQIVVGSYDPNDIVCLEGDTVSPVEIGNYLHYMVNFENTGTFYAENVVVRLEIDDTKFDMNSLQLINSSNPSSTRITGRTVEFVLEGINLAAASGNPPVGGHGDVLFKIKTKGDLSENDTVLQRAGIYFDYNFPVITNDAETTFAELSNPIFEFDNTVKIYPNPTSSIINIASDFDIESIELYDVQGRILERHFETASFTKLDISGKSKGIYFLKIKTEKGSKIEKLVKE